MAYRYRGERLQTVVLTGACLVGATLLLLSMLGIIVGHFPGNPQ